MLAIIAMNAHIKNYVLKTRIDENSVNLLIPLLKKQNFSSIQISDKNTTHIRAHYAETPFAIQFESRNFRGLKKNRGLKRVNSEND